VVAPAQALMKARWILNLVLTLLIAALVAFVYFKPASDKPTGTPLTVLDAAAVTRVRIEKTAAEPITLERTPDGWRLQTPVRARANRFNVDSLLRVTTVTSSFQTPASTAALATYGLDKPMLRLLLNDEEILVGAMHPMRQQHYLRYRDTVHLVDSHALATALFNYTAFIDTQLIEQGRKLTALRLPNVRLELKDGVWRREPYDAKISMDRLNDFVAHWQNARALSVEKLSGAPTRAQIELVFDKDGKPTPLKLAVLAYKPEFILARRDEGLEYHFPEEIGNRLLNLDTGEK
jgi:hypothetical protein